jgi:hypothetical protein
MDDVSGMTESARLMAVPILALAVLGIVLALPLRKSWAGWSAFVADILNLAIVLSFVFVGPLLNRLSTSSSATETRSQFPKGDTSISNPHSTYFRHDDAEIHFLLFYPRAFNVEDRSSYNAHSSGCLDDGSVALETGRGIAYRRESVKPFELRLNGDALDLRKGRVFMLHDDATVEQRSATVPLATAMNRDPIARPIGSAPYFGPVIECELNVSPFLADAFLDLDSGKKY